MGSASSKKAKQGAENGEVTQNNKRKRSEEYVSKTSHVNGTVIKDAPKSEGDTHDNSGDDADSVDTANSDDTFSLARRMPRYLLVNGGELTHDEIEVIAKENQNMYENCIREGTEKDLHPSGNDDANDPENVTKRPATRGVSFEMDTIGYYISQSNGEANEQAVNDAGPDNDKDVDNQTENGDKSKRDEGVDLMYEEFRMNYTSRSQLVKKRNIPNKQTMVLSKVGNRYKYVSVPAYLPGQRLYGSRSLAKNYMTSPQYVYTRGKRKDYTFEEINRMRRE